MVAALDLAPVLKFLDDLSRNNDKAWFVAHREAYETARDTFEEFVDGLIDEFRESDDLDGLQARDCMARIYRDVRFSKDKSPYKTNLTAMIAPDGWRGTKMGYYICLGPQTSSMVAGGLHGPTAEQLDRFRQAIVKDATPFKKITGTKAFADAFGAAEGDRLKTAPRGYDRDHPDIDLLQLKGVTAVHRFAVEHVLAPGFEAEVTGLCRAMKPFLDYLKQF